MEGLSHGGGTEECGVCTHRAGLAPLTASWSLRGRRPSQNSSSWAQVYKRVAAAPCSESLLWPLSPSFCLTEVEERRPKPNSTSCRDARTSLFHGGFTIQERGWPLPVSLSCCSGLCPPPFTSWSLRWRKGGQSKTSTSYTRRNGHPSPRIRGWQQELFRQKRACDFAALDHWLPLSHVHHVLGNTSTRRGCNT